MALPASATWLQMRQGRLGMGEFDDHLPLGQDLVQGVHHFDPLGGQPHDLAHIFAHRGVARRLHGPHQLDARGRLHHVHDAAAHAARHAGNDCLDHKGLLT